MNFVYHLLTYFLLLPYTLYWTARALFNPDYRGQLRQRFGFGYPRFEACLWVHAVSVGEVVAAAPLIHALKRNWPAYPVLVTTVTPTGAARVRKLFGDSVSHAYIPFETPDAVERFFDAVRPAIALIMETEIWPNLYRACGQRNIPLVLVSARISPRSVTSYRKLLPLFRETLSHGIVIAAQSAADAERFLSLGANPARTRVVGNIKFDIEVPGDLRERGASFRREVLGDRRYVWIAASTHEGEEEQVLQAHRRVRERLPDALLILVPRHPERAQAVAGQLTRRGFSFVRRSAGESVTTATEVYLVDTLGELAMFYACSDVAFVGGSLVPVGGHNALEPAALGLPILTGPYTFNAEDIAEMLQEAGAAIEVNDATSLADVAAKILASPRIRDLRGAAGQRIVAENRGALDRLMRLLQPLLAQFPDR